MAELTLASATHRWGLLIWPEAPATTRPTLALLGDVGVALVLLVGAAVTDIAGADHQPLTAGLWDLALAAPLVVRRRRPTLAAVLIGLACLAQWVWWRPVFGDLAVLVALFTLAAYGRRRTVLVVAVLTAELGVAMAVWQWAVPERRVLPALMLTGTVTAAWVAGVYVRTHRAWTASLTERADTAERERDSLAREAVAHERARISRELHDVVAHSISVMVTLNDAAVAVGPPGQARDAVAQASEVGRQALMEMSRLLGVLRDEHSGEPSSLAPQPTVDQLATVVELVRSAGPEVEFSVRGDVSSTPASVQLAVFRIVQESLTNILKHARNVTMVQVTVVREGDQIEVVVHDDGQPGPGPARPGEHRLGLTGMRERVALFDGRLDAGFESGGGWQVRARLGVPAASRLLPPTGPGSGPGAGDLGAAAVGQQPVAALQRLPS